MPRGFMRSDEEILNAVRQHFEKLGHTPSTREYKDSNPPIPLSTLISRFGSYSNIVKLVGGNEYVANHSDEEIIEHYRKLAQKLGHAPTPREYRENQLVCIQTIYRRFGSFHALRRLAGVKAQEKKMVSKEEVLADIEHVIKRLNRIPTVEEYQKFGRYGYRHVTQFFKGLRLAVAFLVAKGRIPESMISS